MKQRYQTRKESIERVFGSAKEYHNMRYTREKGKSKMEAKVGLTFACLNLKRLVKMMAGKAYLFYPIRTDSWFYKSILEIRKDKLSKIEGLSSIWAC